MKLHAKFGNARPYDFEQEVCLKKSFFFFSFVAIATRGLIGIKFFKECLNSGKIISLKFPQNPMGSFREDVRNKS